MAASRFRYLHTPDREALKNAADAKARIAIYGTPGVIRALARFEETGLVLSNSTSDDAFLGIVSAMRENHKGVSARDLRLVLMGRD
jgi:coenzyme F420-reducing hydrogenase beta subunit